MAVLTSSVNRHSSIQCIGICHGTHARQKLIAESYGIDRSDVSLNLVGVNHLGFIDTVRIKEKEIPIQEVMTKIEEKARIGHYDEAGGYQDTDNWSIEFAKRFNVIPNNGDKHFCEFFQWFLTKGTFEEGKSIYGLDKTLHSADYRRENAKWFRDTVSGWAYAPEGEMIPDMDKYSSEHLHDIIFGIEGIHGDIIQRELHLNVTNNGSVPNLPEQANLELTCFMSAKGAIPVKNKPIPAFTHGIISRHVAQNFLAEKAAVQKDKQAFLEALHLDPLVIDFRHIPEIAKELWAVNEPYFEAKK
jgi:alpha-galactosidase/6-phospho-beta-glucosidase family protein